MAYMRHPYYVWQDGTFIYFSPETMTLEEFDELTAMRWAQLSVDERTAAMERAVQKHSGNGGCDALCKMMGVPGFSAQLEELANEYKKKEEGS